MKLNVFWTDEAIIEEMKRDMVLAHASGYPIDMARVGIFPTTHNAPAGMRVYSAKSAIGKCSVCAVGATLLGETEHQDNFADEIAYYFGRPKVWGLGLFRATDPAFADQLDVPESYGPSYCAGWNIGKTLYQWAQKAKRPGGVLA